MGRLIQQSSQEGALMMQLRAGVGEDKPSSTTQGGPALGSDTMSDKASDAAALHPTAEGSPEECGPVPATEGAKLAV